MAAAADLLEEAAKLGANCVYPEKAAGAAAKICAREFGRKIRRTGTEKQRFLSAVTDKGVFFFGKTAELLCDKIYLIEDESGAASRIFMSTVRKMAVDWGLDIIVCKCPVFPAEKTEHIFIPQLKLGFVTGNKRHNLDIMPYRTIHAKRFFDEKKYLRHKIKIKFALRCAANLIEEAGKCMKEAKEVHDELEALYIPFDVVNADFIHQDHIMLIAGDNDKSALLRIAAQRNVFDIERTPCFHMDHTHGGIFIFDFGNQPGIIVSGTVEPGVSIAPDGMFQVEWGGEFVNPFREEKGAVFGGFIDNGADIFRTVIFNTERKNIDKFSGFHTIFPFCQTAPAG